MGGPRDPGRCAKASPPALLAHILIVSTTAGYVGIEEDGINIKVETEPLFQVWNQLKQVVIILEYSKLHIETPGKPKGW
jgi:hypothetical protein